MKSIFTTRTFWFNLLSAVSLIILLPELQEILGPNGIRYALLVNAVINVILRYVTVSPVRALSQTFR